MMIGPVPSAHEKALRLSGPPLRFALPSELERFDVRLCVRVGISPPLLEFTRSTDGGEGPFQS
jgi:hypothetical protein